MCMKTHPAHSIKGPEWDRLYESAAAQEGYFTTTQAAQSGYSPQLLAKYLQNRRVIRVRRGVYRLVHFPAGEHEEFVVAWLWTKCAGVFSHETALFLHGLSDVLPKLKHITLPLPWSKRRLRIPKGIVPYFADVPKGESTWIGPVPVTTPLRTLKDCIVAHTSPEITTQAARDAIRRGLVTRSEVKSTRKRLAKETG